MTLELLKYYIINILGNVVAYFLAAVLFGWIFSSIFSIKNNYLPFGWVKKVFEGIWKVLKPVFSWLFTKFRLLLKILLKWFLFALERFVVLIVDLFRKLFELVVNPED